jgi:hypothetical protein
MLKEFRYAFVTIQSYEEQIHLGDKSLNNRLKH